MTRSRTRGPRWPQPRIKAHRAAVRVIAAERLEDLLSDAVDRRDTSTRSGGSAWLVRQHAVPQNDARATQLVADANTPPSAWPEAKTAGIQPMETAVTALMADPGAGDLNGLLLHPQEDRSYLYQGPWGVRRGREEYRQALRAARVGEHRSVGGSSQGSCDLRILRADAVKMNDLSTLGMRVSLEQPSRLNNSVLVEAGDDENGMATVFFGTISNAWSDFQPGAVTPRGEFEARAYIRTVAARRACLDIDMPAEQLQTKSGSPQPLYGDGDVDVSGINVGGHLSDGRDKRLYDGQITGKRCGAATADADEPALLHDSSVLPNNLRDTCGNTAPATRNRQEFGIAQLDGRKHLLAHEFSSIFR